jgi:alpha-N-acetylglucosaminidase
LYSSWWADPYPQWLKLEMRQPIKLKALHVWPYWGGGRYYQYTVEVSLDGTTWDKVGDFSHNTQPSTPAGDQFEFPPRSIRYVRVNMLYDNLNTGVHIVEVGATAASAGE